MTKVDCFWGPLDTLVYLDTHPQYKEIKKTLLNATKIDGIGHFITIDDENKFQAIVDVENLPSPNYITKEPPQIFTGWRKVAFPNFNGNHIFDLSIEDMILYYHKLFENRTRENKLYIDKYNSLEELEEDIYGKCTHSFNGEWTTRDFKEIYNSLDKLEFMRNINSLIEKYGNMINTYTKDICIKFPTSIKLLDCLKDLYPDIEIETWEDALNNGLSKS